MLRNELVMRCDGQVEPYRMPIDLLLGTPTLRPEPCRFSESVCRLGAGRFN